MTVSWLFKPSPTSILIFLLMTLQISACNSNKPAETTDDNIISSDPDSAETTDNNIISSNPDSTETTDNNIISSNPDTAETTDNSIISSDPDSAETTDNNIISSNPDTAETPILTDISLSWVAPTEREDNEPISLSEIAGYKVYYGTIQNDYPNSININDSSAEGYTFKGFSTGTYYFVLTTYDTEGRESQYSTTVKIVV